MAYHGRTPCCAGTIRIVFQIPRTHRAAAGSRFTCAPGERCQQRDHYGDRRHRICAEPSNALPTALLKGGSIASVLVARVEEHHDVGVQVTSDTTADLAASFIDREQQGPFNFNPMFSLPPPGTCTAYTSAGNAQTLPGMTPTSGFLDAGTLSAATVNGSTPFISTRLGVQQEGYLGGQTSTLLLRSEAIWCSIPWGPDSRTGREGTGAFQTSERRRNRSPGPIAISLQALRETSLSRSPGVGEGQPPQSLPQEALWIGPPIRSRCLSVKPAQEPPA